MPRTTAFKLNRDNLLRNSIALFLLSSLPLTAFAKPAEVQVSSIQNCHYLDQVEGSSGYGKNLDWNRAAKYSALSHAEKLGASHVVWERIYPFGAFNGIAIAKAYNCNS
jgi:hypothetical protein